MAHFAQLDVANVVQHVIVVNDDELIDDGQESESKGAAFCASLFGGRWVQTSYNAYAGKRRDLLTQQMTDEPGFRKNYAGVGFTYDEQRDAFIPPKPDEGEWVLNEVTCLWEPVEPEPAE